MKIWEVQVSQSFGAFLIGVIVGAPTGAFVVVLLLSLGVLRSW